MPSHLTFEEGSVVQAPFATAWERPHGLVVRSSASRLAEIHTGKEEVDIDRKE